MCCNEVRCVPRRQFLLNCLVSDFSVLFCEVFFVGRWWGRLALVRPLPRLLSCTAAAPRLPSTLHPPCCQASLLLPPPPLPAGWWIPTPPPRWCTTPLQRTPATRWRKCRLGIATCTASMCRAAARRVRRASRAARWARQGGLQHVLRSVRRGNGAEGGEGWVTRQAWCSLGAYPCMQAHVCSRQPPRPSQPRCPCPPPPPPHTHTPHTPPPPHPPTTHHHHHHHPPTHTRLQPRCTTRRWLRRCLPWRNSRTGCQR